MVKYSEVFVEYTDSNTGEDVIDTFKFTDDLTDIEIEEEVASMLHPFEFKILK